MARCDARARAAPETRPAVPASLPTTKLSEGAPERRVHRHLFLRLKSRHGVQPAAADNSDFCLSTYDLLVMDVAGVETAG